MARLQANSGQKTINDFNDFKTTDSKGKAECRKTTGRTSGGYKEVLSILADH